MLGAAVSLIGSFAIDFGRGLIVDGVKKVRMMVVMTKWRRITQCMRLRGFALAMRGA